jgi:hypothetical protein
MVLTQDDRGEYSLPNGASLRGQTTVQETSASQPNSWQDGTYHDLLDREEGKLDEAFGNMMPDELPGAVVAAAEVWLDDAYDNITLAQACMAARREQEEERIATLREHPELPDGETSADKARGLWILRALQQTLYVSHIAWEICDDSTKANWSAWSYREYRRLLDEETMTVCRIYAEVELADLPVLEGKEAKGWLTSAHQDAKHAREHNGGHIKKKEELRALLYPGMKSSSLRSQRSIAQCRVFLRPRVLAKSPRSKLKVRQTEPGAGEQDTRGGNRVSWQQARRGELHEAPRQE